MKAVTWHGKRDVRVEDGPRPVHPGADRRDHPGHHDQHLRLRPAPLRAAGAVHGRGRHPRPRAHGHRRGGRLARSTDLKRRRPRRRSPSRSPAGTAGCATSSSTRSARPPRCATRAWARRCSASPSSTARWPAARPSTCGCRRRSSPTSRCPTGPPDDRFVYLSDVLPTAWQARRVRRRARRRHARRPRPRPDRRLGLPDRPAQGLPGDRRRPGARAAGAGRARGARGRRPQRARQDLGDAIRDMTGGRGPDSVHRRRRHGGARLAGREVRPAAHRAAAATRSPRR